MMAVAILVALLWPKDQLFQNAKFTIKHPKTGKEYNFFMTGTSEMPTEVFEEIFQNDKFKADQIFQSI